MTRHPYAEKVYVHSVYSQRDHIFEDITLDVLNFFTEQDDAEEFQNDLREFIGQLLDEKNLVRRHRPLRRGAVVK